jgi:hypothetical protein
MTAIGLGALLLVIHLFGAPGRVVNTKVTIVAMNSFGESLGNFKVILFKDDHGKDYSNRFVGSVAEQIPAGEYIARIRIESGGWVTRHVAVNRPHCLLIFAHNSVTIEHAPGSAPVVNGVIQSLPADLKAPIWVKLCDLYLDGCDISQVDGDNHFSFNDIIPASFVVSVLSASGEVMTERVDIRSANSVLIVNPTKTGRERIKVSDQRTLE